MSPFHHPFFPAFHLVSPVAMADDGADSGGEGLEHFEMIISQPFVVFPKQFVKV